MQGAFADERISLSSGVHQTGGEGAMKVQINNTVKRWRFADFLLGQTFRWVDDLDGILRLKLNNTKCLMYNSKDCITAVQFIDDEKRWVFEAVPVTIDSIVAHVDNSVVRDEYVCGDDDCPWE